MVKVLRTPPSAHDFCRQTTPPTPLEEQTSSAGAQALASPTVAIQHDGVTYLTIVDARAHFGVSEKTIYGWIERGVIPEPAAIERGMQTIYVFDAEYFAKADAALAESRRRKRKQKRGGK